MAEVGLLPFARVALQVSKAVLPRYRSRFSKRLFNQPQLLAILCLMRYEDWTFREAEVRLGEHRELRQALGLASVPDFTTLYRFLQRLDDVTIDRAVGETVRRLRGARRKGRRKARVAVDATGLAQGAVSTFFVRRMHHHGQKPLPWRHWLKWVVVADLDQQFLLAQIARRGPWNDCANLPAVVQTASQQTPIGLVLADAEFDSERNHTYIRQQLGAQSVIPAKRGKKTWRIHGVRAEMRRSFPRQLYRRRALIETLFSSVKRKLSARAPGRTLPMQKRQALLLGLSFNLYRLRHRRLFLRMSTEPAHVVVSGNKRKHTRKSVGKTSRPPKLWPDYALVWDTETTLDLEQKLNFGVWRFCKLEYGDYVSLQEGIFYRDGLPPADVPRIIRYAKNRLADRLVLEADPELVVLTRAEFVERVFWESVRAGALIVGFNLPFDISRIAVRWTAARNGGFSFVLSQLSKKHVENHHRPRIRIAPLNGVAEKIELTAVRRSDEQHRWRRDRFLDLHTLAFALTDKSYSLAGAIDAFGSSVTKTEHQPTGKISDKEISYARQDVRATLALLNALKREYKLHPIRLPPYRAYSPASIGKAYLRAMGIEEPLAKFRCIPPRIHGIAMSAYFGGRAECRIRRWPVPVVPVDLTSEYPSVDALLGIWKILTAQRLEIVDATEEVRRILKSITLKRLFQPSFWKKLNFYASVIPEGDVVPVRTIYGSNGGSCNIGLNELHWKQNLWLAGPDLVSAVLSGRIPNVRKAFRIVPRGKQRGLKTIELRGAIPVDPRKEDFFTRVIEYRKQNKNNDQLQYFLKILANSTSYGTYLELNPVKVERENRPTITIYSGDFVKKQLAPDTIEQPGSFYFPLLGALITSGGRLLLAMIERCVRDAGGTYLCCDTDALTIVASKRGGIVRMPNGAAPIRALSWKEVKEIARRFDSLSPYNRAIVPHLLRLTDENFDEKGIQRQLYGLSIAAKRYALYTTKCGNAYCNHSNCIKIVDPKAHGLIFFAPSDDREDGLPKWWWELWQFLLKLEFKQITDPDFNVLMIAGKALNADTATAIDGQPKWISLPAMMKMRISTPHYLEQMKGKVSPYGFVLHPRTREKAKLTLLTPFNKHRSVWHKLPCINTRDGRGYQLNEMAKCDVITLGDVLCGYIQHPEIKSLGPNGEKCKPETRGLLKRISIKGGLQHAIGKEISRFEQGQDDFIENIDDACIRYEGGRVAASKSLIAEIKKRGLKKATKQTGLDRKTIRAIANGEKVKASTLAKLVIGIQ